MKTKIDYKLVEINYRQGMSDYLNAKIVGCTKASVRNWRLKNELQPNNIATKDIKFDKEQFLELFKEGLTDMKIAVKMGLSETLVNNKRREFTLKSNQSHNITITKEMEEVLIGTLLGDSYISCKANSKDIKRAKTGRLVFGHCVAQSEFIFWKWKQLLPLFKNRPQYNLQIRNNKVNASFYCHSLCSESLVKYHKMFYDDNYKKIITEEICNLLTPKGLATLFMDDGSTKQYIALCNFSLGELEILQNVLWKTWNIDSNVHKKNILYIPKRSLSDFTELISPYIIPSMKYKLSL